MVQTLKAQNIDLRYLIEHFGLQRIRDEQFFGEWQANLPELTDIEKQQLDRVQEGYLNLVEYPPLLENLVKLTIVSPILFIAGLYLSPFHIRAEKSLNIRAEDEGAIIEGKIDILVLKQNFWVTVIESKQISFSIEEGLAQILTYMLADPNPETPTFGMITNGVNFRFVKLVREETPKYALSNEFVIDNRGNELYSVLKILKHLSQLAGLSGYCDYILTASKESYEIRTPVVTLAEAKNESIKSGLGECIAEMVAAQLFNQRNGEAIESIYGAVTTGTDWKFLKLIDKTVWIDKRDYFINEVSRILGILAMPFKVKLSCE